MCKVIKQLCSHQSRNVDWRAMSFYSIFCFLSFPTGCRKCVTFLWGFFGQTGSLLIWTCIILYNNVITCTYNHSFAVLNSLFNKNTVLVIKMVISFLDNPDQDHLNSDTGVPVATHRMSLQVIREQVDTCRM